MTRESSGGETKSVQEYSHEGENEVDKVLGKVIERSKSYNISFKLEIFISYEDMK